MGTCNKKSSPPVTRKSAIISSFKRLLYCFLHNSSSLNIKIQPILTVTMFRPRLFHSLCDLYCRSLQNHPLATKAVTAASMAGASDVACQTLEQRPALLSELAPHRLWEKIRTVLIVKDDNQPIPHATPDKAGTVVVMAHSGATIHYNWTRTLQVCLVGLCWAGPAQHTWYNVLERVVRTQHRVLGLVSRLALDAAVFTPFGLAGYFTCRSLLEGRDWDGVAAKLQHKWSSAVLTSWHFWPAANVINFTIVPLHFRVLYWSVLSFFWQGYLTQTNEMVT